MSPSKRVVVWKIPNWTNSKYQDGKNVRIALKNIDTNESYHLNLVSSEPDILLRWFPAIAEGSILDVKLQSNGKNVDRYAGFQVVKHNDGKELKLP